MSVNKQVFWLRGRSTPPALPIPLTESVASWRFVARYSGATARDLHPLPYSPRAVARGTCSSGRTLLLVGRSKNYTAYRVLLGSCQAGVRLFCVALGVAPTRLEITRQFRSEATGPLRKCSTTAPRLPSRAVRNCRVEMGFILHLLMFVACLIEIRTTPASGLLIPWKVREPPGALTRPPGSSNFHTRPILKPGIRSLEAG